MNTHVKVQIATLVLAVALFAALGGRATALLRRAILSPAPPSPTQDESVPAVTWARLKAKKLIVRGSNFANGAIIRVNGIAQKTVNDSENPNSILIAKKAGKRTPRGAVSTLQVQNPDGQASEELFFYTGCDSQ